MITSKYSNLRSNLIMISESDTNFNGQRISDRLFESPEISAHVLNIIRFNPDYDLETAGKLDNDYGGSAAYLYSFLIDVVKDRELYEAIKIPEEVSEEAYQTQPEIQQSDTTNSLLQNRDIDAIKQKELQTVYRRRGHELFTLITMSLPGQIDKEGA